MTLRRIGLWAAALAAAAAAGGVAALAVVRTLELPPARGVPLAALLEAVERKNFGAIRAIEFERDWLRFSGLWELEVCREGGCLRLTVDAATGEEIRRDSIEAEDPVPPAQAARAVHIARAFAKRGIGVITEMEFEHGAWQVQFRGSRGLFDALQPDRRRVFELAPVSLQPRSPRRAQSQRLQI